MFTVFYLKNGTFRTLITVFIHVHNHVYIFYTIQQYFMQFVIESSNAHHVCP